MRFPNVSIKRRLNKKTLIYTTNTDGEKFLYFDAGNEGGDVYKYRYEKSMRATNLWADLA